MLTALRFATLILLLGGILYPLAMTGLGQIFFSSQANGSFIKLSTGKIVASRLIGQVFTRPEYFHSRPSANAYDAANSGGSNLAPTSRKLIERMKRDAVLYRKENPQQTALPIDALTASASGLDPHISLANALGQVPRVAAARKLSPGIVKRLVGQLAENNFLAESPYINVLELNLALDQLQGKMQLAKAK